MAFTQSVIITMMSVSVSSHQHGI